MVNYSFNLIDKEGTRGNWEGVRLPRGAMMRSSKNHSVRPDNNTRKTNMKPSAKEISATKNIELLIKRESTTNVIIDTLNIDFIFIKNQKSLLL